MNILKEYFVVFCVLLLAVCLRYINIEKHGLAGDEKYSLFVSQFVAYEGNNQQNSVRNPNTPYFTPKQFWSEKSITDFYDAIARIDTGNGAAYTFSLHYWSNLFGNTDGQLRLYSLFFNILTVVLIFYFSKKHFKSTKIAFIALFLATISPFYVAYSQVARNYAMLFFFSLLASHLLLLWLQTQHTKRYFYLVLYGISALICELCHVATFPLFMIHGLFILLYERSWRNVLHFGVAMLIPFFGGLAWLNTEGGKWLFDYVSNSTRVYNDMARNHPDDYLSVATLPHIFKQIRHVISCGFINLEGLYLHVFGSLNFVLISFFTLILYTLLRYTKKIIFPVLYLLSISIFIIFQLDFAAKWQNIVLSFNILLLIHLIVERKYKALFKNKTYAFLGLLLVLPYIFLVLFALRDGNTFRIMPRYVGYSYAYGIILFSLILNYIFSLENAIKYFFLIGIAVQFVLIFNIDKAIWEDKAPRYFMGQSKPRIPNPYKRIADLIITNYSEGDTVIYCSQPFENKSYGKNMPQFSVLDAQLTNFYLPKIAEYWQRIDTTEHHKVYLYKFASKKKFLLTDLTDLRY